MAGTSIPVKCLDDITDCPICTETYADPRALPCIHTFCLKCITSWGKDKEPGDGLACPLCRKEVKIPAGGLGELQKNFFMENLIEMRKLGRSSETKKLKNLCDICGEDESKPAAERTSKMYCGECHQNLCQKCAEYHQKVRMTKSHKLIDSNNREHQAGMLHRATGSFCDKHEDERLKLYCFDCKLAICMMCFVKSHKAHECVDVKEVAHEMSGKMKDNVDGIAGKIKECGTVLNTLVQIVKYETDRAARVEKEISKRAEDLKQLIDKYRDSLLEELKTKKKACSKNAEIARQEVEGQKMLMESFVKYSNELLTNGTVCDIIGAAGDLHTRAREFIELDVSEFVEVDSLRVEFDVSFSCQNVFGDAIKTLFGELESSDISVGGFPDSVKPIHVIPSTGEAVGGVTSLGDEVYVVRHEHQQVQVYDVSTMSQKHTIRVAGLGHVYCGLAACGVNKCLYIADHDHSVVHRVELTDRCTVSKWFVFSSPAGVSVNAKHNVLVAGYGKNKIQEYTTRGSLVREFYLPSTTGCPNFAVQLTDDQFGVTHEGNNHGYSVVACADRRVIKSYGSGSVQMYCPYGVVINKRGFVFIADRDNNRIVVLNPETFTSRELPVSVDGGLNRPMCLYLDESRDRLYIGEETGGRVIVVNKIRNIRF